MKLALRVLCLAFSVLLVTCKPAPEDNLLDKAGKAASDAADATKDAANTAADKTVEAANVVADKASDLGSYLSEKAKEAHTYVKDKLVDAETTMKIDSEEGIKDANKNLEILLDGFEEKKTELIENGDEAQKKAFGTLDAKKATFEDYKSQIEKETTVDAKAAKFKEMIEKVWDDDFDTMVDATGNAQLSRLSLALLLFSGLLCFCRS